MDGVNFWNDTWYRDSSLRVSFLLLNAITTSKDVWVANVWEQSNERKEHEGE